ncbi:hypothetical protein [Candidatus Amarolinea aalborgensis]|jgi:hypothetical protein|uniref:hypothetical protein n=1 Tax=Candidatus Amarolinea aalborgensis TaxID=2249329 RepID=UPI003BF9ED71
MQRALLLIGPALFLLAEIILPGGSADPATRTAIVQAHGAAWALGHQVIAVAFTFLVLWLGDLYTFVRVGNELTTFFGALLSVFALIADYAVAMLQLLTLDLVRTEPADQVAPVLALVGRSSNLMALAFLPTLGFCLGFGLLAIGFYRRTRQALPAALLAAAGLLITVAGVMQVKWGFVLGALALAVFALLFASVGKRFD